MGEIGERRYNLHIEADLINKKEMKKKFKRVKKKAETKMFKSALNWKNKVIAINTCALSVLIMYGAGKMGKGRTENIGYNDKKGVDNDR